MRLTETDADKAFRQEVRHFFDNDYPQDIRDKIRQGVSLNKDDYRRSEYSLYQRGWVAPRWPKEYGGPGWNAMQRHIFDEELEKSSASPVLPTGLQYLGPVIYTFGNDEQKKRFLPKILSSELHWAQGYSEPGSGSDLASLRCKAERVGDEYIITGEKIWSTFAHFADWMFALVRTDNSGRKHEGITFLMLDMKSPGVSVHPIVSIDGKHHFNRTEFDGVRVPVSNRIGEEGKGWHYATYLLSHERTSYAHIGARQADLLKIRQMASTIADSCGRPMLQDPIFAAKLVEAEIALDTLKYTTLRILADTPEGQPPGDDASILKILATETAQLLSTLMMELVGPDGLALFDDWVTPAAAVSQGISASGPATLSRYFTDRAQTIYGGSNEIQRNVIARRVLGL